MRFIYEYRTSDNVPHTDEIAASDREAAFRILRERGIRPGRLVEAPGFFNKLFGKGKRWLTIAVLCVTLAIVVGRGILTAPQSSSVVESTARHQIYGDPVILEPFERGDFSGVFADAGDRHLARYAQPGRLMPSLEGDAVPPPPDFSVSVLVSPDDPREIRELKEIVGGMREELRGYLAEGGGTWASYCRRLDERLDEERAIYERTRLELENEKDPGIRQERNDELRRLGLKTVPRKR